MTESKYGGSVKYKHLTLNESEQCIKNINTKDISENIHDVAWLISVGRLAVWYMVKWSCFTKECPVYNGYEYTAHAQWRYGKQMKNMGLDINICEKTIMYRIFEQKNSKNFY